MRLRAHHRHQFAVWASSRPIVIFSLLFTFRNDDHNIVAVDSIAKIAVACDSTRRAWSV